ncbi:hypothetical protein jhhlp_001296 [Lomentospora prolificans]|uniref:DNA repair protein REV1 n=1 Tax=Lomentospora prolificans TaxID=41688 RepID=A0A2N3NHU2_9PEZI|nr:hypothetical protein jhhlp_001296 [Lomentospora prolificans]
MGTPADKNSSEVRKRIENHRFDDEEGEEYGASEFGGFSDYFRRKKIKLQNLDAELRTASSDLPQIFKGVVAHVSGYTQPPLHILHKELVRHGAAFLQYLDSKTMATHIIASSLTPKKAIEFARYRIVKPAWVMDSINAGRLLPWADYRVVDEGPRQKVLKFDGGKMLSQNNSQPRAGYREQTQNSFYNSQFTKASEVDSSLGSLSALASASSKLPQAFKEGSSLLTKEQEQSDSPAQGNSPGIIPDLHHDLDVQGPRNDGFNDQVKYPDERPETQPEPEPANNDQLKNMTSEEYNAWLLTDPHIRKASSANPNFLKQFYSESRLHHLSTWKAELKSKMQRMANERGLAPKPMKRAPGCRRYVMHVDFDSFFCAVSLKKHPEYINKPAVVAHGTGTGSEIASCNYPAREFGVKNGMWMKRALELCPDLKVLPYDFPAYEEASRQFYEAILDVGGVVQSVSIDEALVDITAIVMRDSASTGKGVDEGSIWREQEKADHIAAELRAKIAKNTGCAVSVGIGANILLAKVALRKAKPNGQYQVRPEQVLDLLGELEVTSLPGVAYSTGGKLEELGIKFVKDLRATSKERLTTVLGPKTGEKLWEYARGIDKTEVGDQPPRKSVSAEVSWGIRFIKQAEAEEFMMNLCQELERRLLNEQVKGRNLTVKVMRRALDAPFDTVKHLGHGKCDTFNKSVIFGVATNSAETIGREAVSVLRSFKFSPGDLRGLGVQMTKLDALKPNLGLDGSQKRLQFPAFTGPSPVKRAKIDPIEDIQSPPRSASNTPGTAKKERDPIIDPMTPKRPRGSMHPALLRARYYESDPKAKTPLNVSGTQFILPANPDPAVVAELPVHIRSRLIGQGSRSLAASQQNSPSTSPKQQNTPALADIAEPLPPQIDPEVFNALPADMKAEVLLSYRRQEPAAGPSRSPHTDRIVAPTKKPTTPTKKGAGVRNLWGKAKERQRDAEAGLMQTNFLERRNPEPSPSESEAEELDPEILAELPEDVRREVLEDHRRRRLARKSGLNMSRPNRRANAEADSITPGGQTKLAFPPPPIKASFGSSGISSTQGVKDMLDAWLAKTSASGPHRADVQMLEQYLCQVVVEERNMEKALSIIKYLDWILEQDDMNGKAKQAWLKASESVKQAVQTAARQRGLRALNI